MTQTIERFDQLQLSPPLLKALADVGYETPSPIQAACIPILLEGGDLLGEAQTGTGKTAAFALPMLERLDLTRKVPQVLVLTPTRELAIQVAEAFQKYAHNLPGFHVVPVYGGQSMVVQLRQLKRGAHVIVGTPGRIMDHLERESLVLSDLRGLVLDEADEMLRMGFIDDVEWILEHTPSERQTALFSATMPDMIRRVAHKHLRDPKEVKIRSATSTVAAIRQRYWQVVRGVDKIDALTRILEVEENFDAAIVFVRTKTATAEIAEKLEARGYEAAALNGDMNQALREGVIDRLKNGALDIVVATDVAARGIDVPRVSHVINFDIPYDTEAYVHRIGRTGRAGRPGTAILFVAPREVRMLHAIERATRQPIERIALPTREDVAGRRVAQFKQQVIEVLEGDDEMGFFEDVVSQLEAEQEVDLRQIAAALALMAQRERPLQIPKTEWAEEPTGGRERPTRDERPRRDFQGREGGAPYERPAFNRGGEGERPSFNRGESDDSRGERPRAPRQGGLVKYRIDVGRAHGVMPKEIVGAIANEAGIEGRMIGRIDLFEEHSTVELPALPADQLNQLKRTRVRQRPLNIRALSAEEAGASPRTEKRMPGAHKRPGFGGDDRPPRHGDDRPARYGDDRRTSFGGDRPPQRAGFGGDRPFRKDGAKPSFSSGPKFKKRGE